MELSPHIIYDDYIKNKIDKSSAINQLLSLIDNSENLFIRIQSIKKLDKIKPTDKYIFDLLENLLISDSQ